MRKRLAILLAIVMLQLVGASCSFAACPLLSRKAFGAGMQNGDSHNAAIYNCNEAAPQETKPLYADTATPQHKHKQKSQLIALILCIGLGIVGVHRYYLGYFWQGIIQTMTAGGCGVWALIDLIRIITGDLQPKDRPYDKTLRKH